MKRTLCPEKKRYPVINSEKHKRNPRMSYERRKREARAKRMFQNHGIHNYSDMDYQMLS